MNIERTLKKAMEHGQNGAINCSRFTWDRTQEQVKIGGLENQGEESKPHHWKGELKYLEMSWKPEEISSHPDFNERSPVRIKVEPCNNNHNNNT